MPLQKQPDGGSSDAELGPEDWRAEGEGATGDDRREERDWGIVSSAFKVDCRKHPLGCNDGREQRGSSVHGPNPSRTTVETLQQPGVYLDQELLQYIMHIDYNLDAKICMCDLCKKNLTVQCTHDSKEPLNLPVTEFG